MGELSTPFTNSNKKTMAVFTDSKAIPWQLLLVTNKKSPFMDSSVHHTLRASKQLNVAGTVDLFVASKCALFFCKLYYLLIHLQTFTSPDLIHVSPVHDSQRLLSPQNAGIPHLLMAPRKDQCQEPVVLKTDKDNWCWTKSAVSKSVAKWNIHQTNKIYCGNHFCDKYN